MIVATTRTKNEENNIEKFCLSYLDNDLADLVLIADGGSDDNTVEIAQGISGVLVSEYSGQIFNEEDDEISHWRNPHGEHINFLNDWAIEEDADWIIFDDCDCTPNRLLKLGGREIIESTDKEFVYAVRVYFWGEAHWFPRLSINFKEGADAWMHSLWGWRSDIGFEASEENPWLHEFIYTPPKEKIQNISPPLALLHRPWPTEDRTDAKMSFYREIGQHPAIKHPTNFGGPMEEIKEWMR